MLFIGCSENRVDVNELTNKGTDLTVNPSGSVWYHYDNLFTGIGYGVYQNDQLESEISYKDGKYDGLSKTWYENGQLRYEEKITEGELISRKCWDENGKEIECE